jgi:transposase
MARPRKKLDMHGQGPEVLRLLKKTPAGWKRERLLAVKLGLENELGIREIAEHLGRAHQTVQDWFHLFREGGLTLLLKKDKGNGSPPALDEQQMAHFKAELEKNQWRTGKQAYDWLRKTFGVTFHPQRVYVYLKKLGARLKVPRPSHRKKNPETSVAFKETLCQRLIDLDLPRDKPVRLWIYDEARYGLAPVVRRMWTTRGSEVVCPVEKRYQWGYVFGALQVGGGGCEFLLSPTVSKEADKCFLRQIADRDPGATHVVIGDGAGFHHRDMGDGLPQNVRLITLPPYSPELNPVEKLWNLMKDTLCNRCFESLDECDATITEFLRSFWEDARKVYSLIGDGYLPSKLNAI